MKKKINISVPQVIGKDNPSSPDSIHAERKSYRSNKSSLQKLISHQPIGHNEISNQIQTHIAKGERF